jgi:hypothetical protein
MVDDILVCHAAQHHSSCEYPKHVGSLSHGTHPSSVTDQIPLYKKKEKIGYLHNEIYFSMKKVPTYCNSSQNYCV